VTETPQDPFQLSVEALEKAGPIFEERGYPTPVRPEGIDDGYWETKMSMPPVVWRYDDGIIMSREVPSHLIGADRGLMSSALIALSPGDPGYEWFETEIAAGYDLYKGETESNA
jgi:hypothetical protein